MADEGPRLTRSETDRLVAGVCGGLGHHLGVDPNIVRVVFALLTIFGGSGVVLYLVLWLIVPRASNVAAMPRDVVRDGVDEGRRMARQGVEAAKRGYRRMRGDPRDAQAPPGPPGAGAPPPHDPDAPPGPPPPDAGAPPPHDPDAPPGGPSAN